MQALSPTEIPQYNLKNSDSLCCIFEWHSLVWIKPALGKCIQWTHPVPHDSASSFAAKAGHWQEPILFVYPTPTAYHQATATQNQTSDRWSRMSGVYFIPKTANLAGWNLLRLYVREGVRTKSGCAASSASADDCQDAGCTETEHLPKNLLSDPASKSWGDIQGLLSWQDALKLKLFVNTG